MARPASSVSPFSFPSSFWSLVDPSSGVCGLGLGLVADLGLPSATDKERQRKSSHKSLILIDNGAFRLAMMHEASSTDIKFQKIYSFEYTIVYLLSKHAY